MASARPHHRLSIAGLLILACGCSLVRGWGRVSGRVTLDGQPLGGAIVTLLASDGRAATAETDAQGAFTVASPLAAGRYRVSITPKAPRSPVPERYFDPATSGLVVEVRGGENSLEINLLSGGRTAETKPLNAG